MDKKVFSKVEKLEIVAYRNLYIRKWDQEDVEIRFPSIDKIDVQNSNGILEIDSKLDCMISAPQDVILLLESVKGNCKISGLFLNIIIESIGGNLEIEEVETGIIERVGGGLKIGTVTKTMTIEKVGANLVLMNNNGSILCEKVGGDLHANGITGGLDCVVGGSIVLSNTNFEDSYTSLKAGGNIKISYSGVPNFRLEAKSGGGYNIDLGKDSIKGIYRTLEHTFGSGGPLVNLKAGGSIKINAKSQDPRLELKFMRIDDNSWDTLEEEIMEKQSRFIDLGDLEFDSLNHQINNEINMKTQMIESKIQNAMDKLDVKFRNNFDSFTNLGEQSQKRNSESSIPKPTKNAVSEEEKMMILKMLQDKKITAEEADKLLNALEQS